MFSVYQPKYLIAPGIMLWLLAIFLSIFCLPSLLAAPIGGLLLLALFCGVSLLHPLVEKTVEDSGGQIFCHCVMWAASFIISMIFAYNVIPWEWGPAVQFAHYHTWTWLQVSYVAGQQICYFGVHAFVWNERKPG